MPDQAVATTTAKPPIVVLRERLEARTQEIEAALPDDIEPRKFVRAVMTSASINPDILACSWQSLWNACLRACRDGLLPDSVEGAIVAYKDRATWVPMYQGLVRRAQRSGQLLEIEADVVREGDTWSYFKDEHGVHFRHEPTHNDLAPIVKVYAYARMKDGGVQIAVMSIPEIEKVKKQSRAQRDDAPWKQWPEAMMRKSALRRLSKLLPIDRQYLPPEEEDDEPRDMSGPHNWQEHPRSAAAALDQFAHAPEIEPTQDDAKEEKDDGHDQDTSGDRRGSEKGGHQSDAKG